MERFIESVRRYPCLWDTASAEYRDHELKDAAWAELVKDTDAASVKEVKQRWKKLRDSYRDALKRQSELQARDAPPAKRSLPWKYMGPMQFLQPHMSARKKRDSPAASPPAAPPPAPPAPPSTLPSTTMAPIVDSTAGDRNHGINKHSSHRALS